MPVNTTSVTILQSHFTQGHQYRVAVRARVGGQESWSERTFNVRGPQTGSFVWPVPSSRRITQRFIYRVHNGIDIGPATPGETGASIVAFAAGEVIRSGWSNSYGWVVYMNISNIGGFPWIQHRYAHILDRGLIRVSIDIIPVGDQYV